MNAVGSIFHCPHWPHRFERLADSAVRWSAYVDESSDSSESVVLLNAQIKDGTHWKPIGAETEMFKELRYALKSFIDVNGADMLAELCAGEDGFAMELSCVKRLQSALVDATHVLHDLSNGAKPEAVLWSHGVGVESLAQNLVATQELANMNVDEWPKAGPQANPGSFADLEAFVVNISRMTTDEEMGGNMSGDDAVTTLSTLVETARDIERDIHKGAQSWPVQAQHNEHTEVPAA